MPNVGLSQVRVRQIAPGKGQTRNPPLRAGRAFVLLEVFRELFVVDQIFPM
jgi:hypothetical protein